MREKDRKIAIASVLVAVFGFFLLIQILQLVG